MITSCVMVGCIFSVLCGTYLIDQFGCKKMIIIGDTSLILCSIIIGFYNKKDEAQVP